ncbi:MAG TPA: hypothetical protein VHR72_08635 [Gemmataceae bacterium]|jgi:hypothetical protein|nr:hypothetical protein [Gemmataceae bacterium]
MDNRPAGNDSSPANPWLVEVLQDVMVLLAAHSSGNRPVEEMLLVDLLRLGLKVEFVEPSRGRAEGN